MADDLAFDFEADIPSSHLLTQGGGHTVDIQDLSAEVIGQQPGNFKKNFRKTVCTYWLRGLCMKGDQCGFLHQFATDRMPVCRNLLKHGECKDQDCPYKHTLDDIKECNMFKLGFCIYGPQCRFKHVKIAGPPPKAEEVEACKPREYRNVNVVVNQVNPGVLGRGDDDRDRGGFNKRPRFDAGPYRGFGGERDRGFGDRGGRGPRDQPPLALPAPAARDAGRPQPPRGPAPPPGNPPAGGPPPHAQHERVDHRHGGGSNGMMPPIMGPAPPRHQQQHHQQQHHHPSHGPPPALPPMAGLLAPMPNIMPSPMGGPGGGPQPPPFLGMPPAYAGQGYGGFQR